MGEKGQNGSQPLVVVIGAAGLDIKGRASHTLMPGTSAPGEIRNSVGGVARNVAENLARLGVQVVLLSAVGEDGPGRRLIAQAEECGINVRHVIRSRDHHTGAYLTVSDETGKPFVSVDDMKIMELITPAYIYANRRWFRDASMVVLDANVPPKAMESVFKLAERYGVPVSADPTSAVLAERLKPFLPRLYMVTPNVPEAEVFCGGHITHREGAIRAARRLVRKGIRVAIITRAERGVCYATPDASGHVPALQTDIVDLTGAGDALTAGVVFGFLNGFSVDEAVRLGVSAAALTLRSRETVSPELSLERLYDQLVI
ncbi:MAG: carbohydrate kinase family protein [Anaerolineae bacterium]